MTEPKDIRDFTVKAHLTSIPRKFGGKKTGAIVDESILLTEQENILILGDPGSGKTTSLKRLALKLLQEAPKSSDDTNVFPIFIRLRDLKPSMDNPVLGSLESALNIKFSSKEFLKEIIEVTDGKKRVISVVDDAQKNEAHKMRRSFLISILEELSPTIILDGLDEVNESVRSSVFKDIEFLSNSLNNARVILSCRSGEEFGALAGFKIMEICSLTSKDIESVASFWLPNDKADFFKEIEDKGVSDLLDRPLFLVQLLIIYKNQGYIADQPSIISEHIVLLSIKKWQEENRIVRKSKFDHFLPEQKLRFLSEFSFELTYNKKSKLFTRRDFGFIYRDICERHHLPKEQAEEVAIEIESHTGIIQRVGNDKFEFSHLTLQEFLCAKYLSSIPFPDDKALVYLKEYPAPLAVSAAMSMKPSLWLASVLLSINDISVISDNNILVLLERLISEKPTFEVEMRLGVALFKVLNFTYEMQDKSIAQRIFSALYKLSTEKMIKKSLFSVLDHYTVEKRHSKKKYILKICSYDRWAGEQYKFPREMHFDSEHFDKIMNGLFFSVNEYI